MRFERDKDGNLIAVDDNGKKIGSITTSDGAYEERKDKR